MENEIKDYISKAENYIRSHPDTTGTTNAMIALTISIKQVEIRTKELNKTIDNSSKNTKKHNAVIACLTAALIFFTAIQAYAVWSSNKTQNTLGGHVKQKIFDECFDYYANTEQERGIPMSLIQVCEEKASEWIKKIR